ncbi:MAG: hypothetical protein ACTSQM_05305 [Candidatus Odinarchaeia archaeon]
MAKYTFRFEETTISIEDEEGYWIGEFIPEINWNNAARETCEELPKFRRGILSVIAIAFPRHFVEDLFEEGDDLNKLKEVLNEYLTKVEKWLKFLKNHPEMKVVSDGYVDFVLKVEVDLDKETNSVKDVEEAVTPILNDLPLD